MYFQVVFSRKSFIANITFMRFVSSVGSFMYFQLVFSGKSFIANVTLIRFVSSVSSFMYFQVAFLGKSLVANITFIRFLSSVSSFYEFSSCLDVKIFYCKHHIQKGCSLLCVLLCIFKLPFRENLLLQTSHSKGFCVASSFACSKLLEVEKIFAELSHMI